MDVKNILLFSGGMDSFILKKIGNYKDHDCLFVHMGTKENDIESLFLNKFFPSVNRTSFRTLGSFALPNYIIPFRNHHLALIAANYGNNIVFGFTAGDTTKDKDLVFKAQMEGILNYFAIDGHKVKIQRPFVIELPFLNKTKTELVSLYLKLGFPAEDLLTSSISCYSGKETPCGKCRSCLRKYVALTLNDINTEGHWREDPAYNLLSFLKESIDKNRKQEINDIKLCIDQRLR